MAETVDKIMEKFLPALIELQKSQLFTKDELGKLVLTIVKNELRMAAASKSLEVFNSCIKYDEAALKELIKRKEEKKLSQKNSCLNWIFIRRVLSDYQRGLKYFPTAYGFNIAYFEFLKRFPEYRHVAENHVKKMIQVFGHKPGIFRIAASWCYNSNRVDSTRNILLLGHALHPKDLNLYIDLIELETKNLKAKGSKQRLMKYIDAIVKNLNHEFLIEITTILENYGNLQEVVDYAIGQLLSKYGNEEEVWHYIASKELKGIYNSSENKDRQSVISSIEKAVSQYKEGIQKLPPNKQPLLWKKYLQTLMDLLKNYRNPQTVNFLRDALDQAEAAKVKLDETHYLAWMDCCGNNDALLIKKLEQGTKEHSTSVMLWSVYLKHYVLQDEWEFAKMVFRRAIKALGRKADEIWRLYLDFHVLKSPVAEIDSLYEEAISLPYPEIVVPFKLRYLSWIVVAKGIEAARELYLKLADQPPYCRELHEEMLLAENLEVASRRKENFRKQVLDLWMKQFGTEDPNVYIQRMADVPDPGTPNGKQKLAEIYAEAIRKLTSDKVEEFKKLITMREDNL